MGCIVPLLSFSGSFRRLVMRLFDRAVWFKLYTDAFFLLQIQIFVLHFAVYYQRQTLSKQAYEC